MFNTITTLDMLLSCCEDLENVLRIMTRFRAIIMAINYHMHLQTKQNKELVMCAYWLFNLSEAQFLKCRYNSTYRIESV